jgi:hypothetical protein
MPTEHREDFEQDHPPPAKAISEAFLAFAVSLFFKKQ